jgi:hypothetical protein
MGNVPPAEAIDRLGRFREGFDIRQRKQKLFSGGEILFKLPVTEYPEIGVTGKELTLTENVSLTFPPHSLPCVDSVIHFCMQSTPP